MSATLLPRQNFYGLFQLDTSGTVTYSRMEGEGKADRPPTEFDGRNFFLDAAPFLNAEELKRVVDDFRASAVPAASVTFVCEYEDGPEQVRVLLARMCEQSDNKLTKSILMHIRKVSSGS
jgi:hypothetical protein